MKFLFMIQDFSLLTLMHTKYIKLALQVKNGGPGLQMIQGVDGQDGAGEPPLVSNLGFEGRFWKTIFNLKKRILDNPWL